MMDGIANFFSPEAGQKRRAWLDGVGAQANEAARYYLGPTGIPERAGAAANIAGMFSPGADMMDAASASGDMMRARSPMEVATAGAGMVGALGSMFIPGNAQRAGEALTRFGADEAGGVDLNPLTFYHGSPDVRQVRNANAFEARTRTVDHVPDPVRLEDLRYRMSRVPVGGDEYQRLADEADSLRRTRDVPAPVFLTPDRWVASTYADATRATDYRNAEPGIISAATNPQRVLDLDAGGRKFTKLYVEDVASALRSSGVAEDKIDAALTQLRFSGDGTLSTNDLGVVASDLGFDAVDVANVVDTYLLGGPPGRVRMMLDPQQIRVQDFFAK